MSINYTQMTRIERIQGSIKTINSELKTWEDNGYFLSEVLEFSLHGHNSCNSILVGLFRRIKNE